MLNFNGNIQSSKDFKIATNNRSFLYGDGLFETVLVNQNRVVFWEDHYFRLMASMRMLRMEIPMEFTLEFLEEEILKTVTAQKEATAFRVRLSVFRKAGGFYTPDTSQVDFLIEVTPNKTTTKETYVIDLYKDFYNYSGLLSTVKTTNRMINVLAGIYAKENKLDSCILLNDKKGVAEAIHANIFVVSGQTIKTPALTEGCVKGVVRKKVIELLIKNPNYKLEETNISPFELQKADEVFLTNSIIGVQPVTNYRKKVFETTIAKKIAANLKVAMFTASSS